MNTADYTQTQPTEPTAPIEPTSTAISVESVPSVPCDPSHSSHQSTPSSALPESSPMYSTSDFGPRISDLTVSPRGLSRLEGLTDSQLTQLNTWYRQAVSFRKMVELCREKFDREIPKTTLQRYFKRAGALDLLDDSAESQKAAAEISQYAATGDASFSRTTLHILEKEAFDLAIAFSRDRDAEDLDQLKNLSHLIHKAKIASVRERMATVQETKCELRAKELDLKAEKAKSNSTPATQPLSDHLGPYARNPEELSERVRKQQGVPKEEWDRRLARSREILKQRYNPDGTLKVPPTHNPSAPHEAQTISLPTPMSGQEQPCNLTPNPKSESKNHTSEIDLAATPENNQSSIIDNQSISESTTDTQSQIKNQKSQIPSLESRVTQYSLARQIEAGHGKCSDKVGKWAARSFKSKMQYCPCGHRTLPCPDHGDFPPNFWELSPCSTSYWTVLDRANLPYDLLEYHRLLREHYKTLATQNQQPCNAATQ